MKTSDIIVFFITGSLTLLAFVLFIVLIIIEYRRKQVRHITETLRLAHQYQSQVLQTKIEVQEQSFKYFSEELHDNVAQMISLTRMKLYLLAEKTNQDDVKAGITTSNETLGKTLEGLRTLSHVLNGGLVSKIPLAESLEKELAYVHATTDVAVEFMAEGATFETTAEKKLLIFRIVQEAIANAIKHGKAQSIGITLRHTVAGTTIAVKDDGKGFDTAIAQQGRGLGVHNMQVRAQLLGGLNIESAPGKGTTVTVTIS